MRSAYYDYYCFKVYFITRENFKLGQTRQYRGDFYVLNHYDECYVPGFTAIVLIALGDCQSGNWENIKKKLSLLENSVIYLAHLEHTVVEQGSSF